MPLGLRSRRGGGNPEIRRRRHAGAWRSPDYCVSSQSVRPAALQASNRSIQTKFEYWIEHRSLSGVPYFAIHASLVYFKQAWNVAFGGSDLRSIS